MRGSEVGVKPEHPRSQERGSDCTSELHQAWGEDRGWTKQSRQGMQSSKPTMQAECNQDKFDSVLAVNIMPDSAANR